MNKCKYCGENMRDDEDFCTNCHEQNFPCIDCGEMPCLCEIEDACDDKLILEYEKLWDEITDDIKEKN